MGINTLPALLGGQDELDFPAVPSVPATSPSSFSWRRFWIWVLDLEFGSIPRAFIIMTHKSLPAPPVCHVPTHNNCVERLEELGWHGLFVTSGRVTGCGSGSAPAEPGGVGKAAQIPSAGPSPGVCTASGSLLAVGGVGSGI